MIAKCNLCEKENKEFKIPWDEHGSAMMRQHLINEHNITVSSTKGT